MTAYGYDVNEALTKIGEFMAPGSGVEDMRGGEAI